MEKIICEKCGKKFDSEEALAMHSNVKHPPEIDKSIKEVKIKKKAKNWFIFILILGFLAVGIYFMVSSSSLDCSAPAIETNIGGHQNLQQHIHSDLIITIHGEKQVIPANIGIGANLMRPTHTHDSTGKIHIEGPCASREYTLGEFFDVWGERFDNSCIFENCVDENSDLKMYVNDQENLDYNNYKMKDGDKIVIEYRGKNQLN